MDGRAYDKTCGRLMAWLGVVGRTGIPIRLMRQFHHAPKRVCGSDTNAHAKASALMQAIRPSTANPSSFFKDFFEAWRRREGNGEAKEREKQLCR